MIKARLFKWLWLQDILYVVSAQCYRYALMLDREYTLLGWRKKHG